jgi:hypothetical protein
MASIVTVIGIQHTLRLQPAGRKKGRGIEPPLRTTKVGPADISRMVSSRSRVSTEYETYTWVSPPGRGWFFDILAPQLTGGLSLPDSGLLLPLGISELRQRALAAL